MNTPTYLAPEAAALSAVLGELEEVERRLRTTEAERLRVLAKAFDIAAAQNARQGERSVPVDAAGELALRAVRAEIAAALHLSEYAVERRLDLAQQLTVSYPRTGDAHGEGAISAAHASVVVEAGTVIGGGDNADAVARRAAYEEAVLPYAEAETPARLRPIAKRIAEQFAEVSLDERHAEARKRRRVYVVDADDGMSDLVAHLPAVEAHAIHRRLTAAARRAERERAQEQERRGEQERSGFEVAAGAGSRRSRDEIRADLLSAALLDTALPSVDSEPLDHARVGVQVIVPVRSIAERLAATASHQTSGQPSEQPLEQPPEQRSEQPPGPPPAQPPQQLPGFLGREPADIESPSGPTLVVRQPEAAELVGYGPVDSATACGMAGRADAWEVVRVEADSGAVLAVDRYRPSEAIKRFLRARDQRCRFPGCTAPASRCDIDHTRDAQWGGPTSTANLSHLCRGHHTLKHNTGWSVRQESPGVLVWRSPTGRMYQDYPPGEVRFRPQAA